jgi:hypothetical protein
MSDYWQIGSECPIVHYSSSAFQEAHWGSISRPITRLAPATLVERALLDYSDEAKRSDRVIESVRVVHGDLVRVKVCWQRNVSTSLPLEVAKTRSLPASVERNGHKRRANGGDQLASLIARVADLRTDRDRLEQIVGSRTQQ